MHGLMAGWLVVERERYVRSSSSRPTCVCVGALASYSLAKLRRNKRYLKIETGKIKGFTESVEREMGMGHLKKKR